MSADPFAPARRAAWTGPPIALVGGVIIYLGLSGSIGWWVIVPGAFIALFGLLRGFAGWASLSLERQRKRLLREGVQGTGLIKSARQVRTRFGMPVMEMQMEIRAPGREPSTHKKVGAIPIEHAGEMAVGAELPVRVHEQVSSIFALDFAALESGWRPPEPEVPAKAGD